MFFSDLDRTLIYSKRFVPEDMAQDYVPVESKEGRTISYMTVKAYDLLENLRKETMFVPVTARKWDEIMRISFIRNNIPPIMICEAGKEIYRNGVRDEKWDLHMYHLMGLTTYPRKVAENHFRELMENKHHSPVWNINEFMVMTKVAGWTNEQKAEVESWIPWFLEKHCHIHIHERKVYLVPKAITKGYAVQNILNEYSGNSVSSGDTDMDATMFKYTSNHIAPMHHTIPESIVSITAKSGIEAAEDILEYALGKLSSK